jgi:gamma-glutamyl hercynylcysteine S-oxide synthase
VDPKIEIRAALERARAATDALLERVPDEDLVAQFSPSSSPLVWDLVHVAHFEELWLLRTVVGDPPIPELHDDVYAGLRHEGAAYPTLRPAAARSYAEDVRERVFAALERLDLDTADALLRNGFVFGLIVQHELQHQETMLQALQLRIEREYPLPRLEPTDRAPGGPDEILVPAGAYVRGAVDEPWAYDNELVAHEIELEAFWIDRAPVTNAEFAEFLGSGGYRTRSVWSPQGWEWRTRESVTEPLYWERRDGGYERIRFGRREPLPPDEPVQHVSWHEADAFARWAGKRLPTEAEWERAASWHDQKGKLRYPWGGEWVGFEANLDRNRFSPAPAGSYSGGVSPVGCVQMTGDVWEWTASTFGPYLGFLAFPYPEYSEVFFGDEYRVLRGGSWATDGLVARTTFRNWDSPARRQIFAGFRCARDA